MATSDSTTSTRECTKCNQTFPRTEEFWYKNPNTSDKLNTTCKICDRTRSKEWYENHKEQALSKSNERSKRPEVKQVNNERRRKRYREDSEYRELKIRQGRELRKRPDIKQKRRLIQRKYRELPEVQAVIQSERQTHEHKARRKAEKARRRARIADAGGVVTKDDIKLQYKTQRGKCWWCEAELGTKYHADHLVPLARGGSNEPNNIVLTCAACNLSKNDKLPHEWSNRLL